MLPKKKVKNSIEFFVKSLFKKVVQLDSMEMCYVGRSRKLVSPVFCGEQDLEPSKALNRNFSSSSNDMFEPKRNYGKCEFIRKPHG